MFGVDDLDTIDEVMWLDRVIGVALDYEWSVCWAKDCLARFGLIFAESV